MLYAPTRLLYTSKSRLFYTSALKIGFSSARGRRRVENNIDASKWIQQPEVDGATKVSGFSNPILKWSAGGKPKTVLDPATYLCRGQAAGCSNPKEVDSAAQNRWIKQPVRKGPKHGVYCFCTVHTTSRHPPPVLLFQNLVAHANDALKMTVGTRVAT
eukprot:3501637-Amphidinium_carterae.1